MAFSPDGKTLASGSFDNTLRLWQQTERGGWNNEKVIQLLPATQWVSWRTDTNQYIFKSKEAERWMLIRFHNANDQVYPLDMFPQFRVDDLRHKNIAVNEISPTIGDRMRRAWRHQTNKTWWASIGLVILIAMIVVTISYRRRRILDPLLNIRRFFDQAGWNHNKTNRDGIVELINSEKDSALVILLREKQSLDYLTDRLQTLLKAIAVNAYSRIYLIIARDQAIPANRDLQQFRNRFDTMVIPISISIVEAGLSSGNCHVRLQNLEEKYLIRKDPYLEKNPIEDPVWFFGRTVVLKDLSMMLSQGQHVGIFGLRKIGKTSVIKQLGQRFAHSPHVLIDCESKETERKYYGEIITELAKSLNRLGIKAPISDKPYNDQDEFKIEFLRLFNLWKSQGGNEPIILMFDELDKLFRNRRQAGAEQYLNIYCKVFQALRSMAQIHGACALLVVAYRPDINRQNILSDSLPDNPMYKSFHESYLGYLKSEDCNQMIAELGEWKNIKWDVEAMNYVYTLCVGHPLVTREFASMVTTGGEIKYIDIERVKTSRGRGSTKYPP